MSAAVSMREELTAGRLVFRQVSITRYPPASRVEVENRYRCIESRHDGRLYNNAQDATWCMCGRVIRPGDCGRWPTEYERAEADSNRLDPVGIEARAYLDRVHGVDLREVLG